MLVVARRRVLKPHRCLSVPSFQNTTPRFQSKSPENDQQKQQQSGDGTKPSPVPEFLKPLIIPVTEFGRKQEKVRGTYQRSVIAPAMRVLDAKPMGKITPIQTELTPVETAIRFPRVATQSMGDTQVSLPFVEGSRANTQPIVVGLCFRDFGFQFVRKWFDNLEERGFDSSRMYLVYALDAWGIQKMILKFLTRRTLKSVYNHEQLKQVVFQTEQFYDEALALKVDNSYTGYVYLLDNHGKVRWSASGPPSSAEEVDMVCNHIQTLNPKAKLLKSQAAKAPPS
eukprot:TRINITY_DN16911_c0_g1_i2.p1 TRINITY_DN16911_c0_g1~~TRINITY_DN16911_c0_g1_i2.p1  ORF type:complete len:283 (+),score=75.28 TRINITY_DN16911_c0_g1_i2:136-984(+)